jgi:hypothetical protein
MRPVALTPYVPYHICVRNVRETVIWAGAAGHSSKRQDMGIPLPMFRLTGTAPNRRWRRGSANLLLLTYLFF